MKLEADPEQQVITTWQVHTDDQYVLPGMLAKSFVGQSFASPLRPPAQVEVLHQFRCHVKVEVLHLFRCFTHTHTLPREGGKIKVRTVKWRRWKWDESYLTRTRRGERKRRGKEKTPTQDTWPNAGKPWKGKGKERRRQTDTEQDQRGGEGRKRLNQPTTAKPTPT